MRKLSLEWFKGVPPEKHKDFENVIRNSTALSQQIVNILDEWEKELNRQESKLDDYDTASWSHKQAHRNGDRSRIQRLKDLFSFLGERNG